MHENVSRQDLIRALWPADAPPSMKTWAILDAARDPRIYDAIARSDRENVCLFAGRLTTQLKLASPYLVQLARDDRLTAFVLDHGWGNAWGVFLRSNASTETLRRHFRKFLRVTDEKGRRLLFRYYDPRVLRIFLPTCLPDELTTIFDAVDRFLVEAETGDRMIEFQFTGWKLDTSTIDFQTSAHET